MTHLDVILAIEVDPGAVLNYLFKTTSITTLQEHIATGCPGTLHQPNGCMHSNYQPICASYHPVLSLGCYYTMQYGSGLVTPPISITLPP